MLVIEDESSVREIIARILRKHGFVVLAAGSVQGARQTVDTHKGQIDVLLTDTVLPDGNGPSLASELLRLKRVRSALLTSGYAADEVVRRGLANEDIAFVSKPFTSATLVGAIRNVIESANQLKPQSEP